jgi:hypothetical protein
VRRRSKGGVAAAAVGVVLLLVSLVFAGCSDDHGRAAKKPELTSQRIELPSGQIELAGADVVSPAQPLRPLDGAVAEQVLQSVRTLFTAASAEPLVKGRAGEIAPVLTPDALVAAVGNDRGAIFDEGLPVVTRLRVRKGEVRLRALENEAGVPALVVAAIDWQLVAGDARIHRVGDLTLVPRDGRWVINRYSVFVTRTVKGEMTTTTGATS